MRSFIPPIQPRWFHLRTSAGDDQTARLVDSRRPRPGMRSVDVPLLHHLHGDDEQVGLHRPHKNDILRIQQGQEVRDYAALLARILEFRWPRSRKDLVVTTSGKPTIRTILQTYKESGSQHHKFSSREPSNKKGKR